ncbi:MAG: cob(I)yrinic acid a,c-diamide adenosyltransferase [Firmicutes bacterium]|nr:cob(I)yrinic acid a,c-diamide adenosyltransferase [Bacillota bacterium]
MLDRGYIQVYTGNGKGKTTASLGLAIRAAGHGMKVRIIQFMKGNTNYGELQALSRFPEIILYQFGTPDFVYKGQEQQVDYDEAKAALEMAEKIVREDKPDILILDEVNVALYFNLLRLEDVIEFLKSKPEKMEIILTGRNVPQEIIDMANLVTKMEEVRHYYNTINLDAREGIEY